MGWDGSSSFPMVMMMKMFSVGIPEVFSYPSSV